VEEVKPVSVIQQPYYILALIQVKQQPYHPAAQDWWHSEAKQG